MNAMTALSPIELHRIECTLERGEPVKRGGIEIATDFWLKPIPIRKFDWVAYFDGDEPDFDYIGSGATEAEAIADLIENHPRLAA